MPEDSPETARQRATRIWRNAWIQGQSELQNQEQPIATIQEQERLLNQERTKLIAAVNKIFEEQKHTFNLAYYKLVISRRRRRLLEEKLRRLESQQHD
jgi:hypothetical protein